MTIASRTAPFAGVRILDLCEGLAGPAATMYLADFGADVVKIEPPQGDYLAGDPAYLYGNRGKHRRALDLADRADRAELRRLISVADAVVFDWDRDRLERLGLDAATVLSEYPKVVHAWLPPLAARGRWSHLPSDPLLLAAVSGISDYHQATEERPVSPVVPVATYAHGALAAAGIAAALVERLRVGVGRSLVVSGLHAVGAMQAAVLVEAPGLASLSQKRKSASSGLPNYAAYCCADGKWLYLGALTQAFFLATLEVMDLMELMVFPGVDGAFANVIKPDIAPQLSPYLRKRFLERDRADWLDRLDRAGVPVAPVGLRQEWFVSETVAANEMRLIRDHPEHGQVEMPGVPVVLSETPGVAGELPFGHAGTESYWTAIDPAATADETISATSAAERSLPLRGLRVVDAASFVAGTYGPSILALYGASVIKVEPPDGDPYRLFSTSFAAINQGKRGVVLDLKHSDGRGALVNMVRQADVFVENLRDRSRTAFGLDWSSLQAINPRLVHCSVGAYGAGPLADKPGFDPLLQARSGLTAAQGGADSPSSSTMLVHDIGTGALAAVGILTALYWRESSGQGQHVTTSLANSSLMLQAGEFTTYPGRSEPQQGGRDWAGPNALHRLYECADGWVFVAAQLDQTVAVARALGVEPTALSAETIADALRTEPVLATLDRFDIEGVVAAQVLSRHQAFTDSWLLDNDFYHVISDARLGWCRVVRTVTDWPGCAEVANPRSFALGEDTEEVLGEYGFAAEQIASLLSSGAARKWAPQA